MHLLELLYESSFFKTKVLKYDNSILIIYVFFHFLHKISIKI